MAKGNKKPNKSKTKKPKKLKPFERPSEGNPDSAAQTPDVYYNNGPGKSKPSPTGTCTTPSYVFAPKLSFLSWLSKTHDVRRK